MKQQRGWILLIISYLLIIVVQVTLLKPVDPIVGFHGMQRVQGESILSESSSGAERQDLALVGCGDMAADGGQDKRQANWCIESEVVRQTDRKLTEK